MTRSILADVSPKMTRRLAAAEGYLELELPHRAHEELDSVDVSDLGPLASSWQFLKGETFRMQGEFELATGPLEAAARSFPSPLRRFAWTALADCYERMGNMALASFAQMLSKPEEESIDEMEANPAGALRVLRDALAANLDEILSAEEVTELVELIETQSDFESDSEFE